MALSDPNVQLSYQNFCIGPQLGTFATIDTSNPVLSRMFIKNNTGGLIATYNLDTLLSTTVYAVEYIGPRDMTAPYTGATFFTFQRVSSSQSDIRRWELNTSTLSLELKNTISKTDAGAYHYDCYSFAVEHWEITFTSDVASGTNTIEVSDISNVSSGDRLWLGPSTDTDNPDAVEQKIVNYTYTDGMDHHFIVLTTNLTYDFVATNKINWAKYIYLFTDTHSGDGRGAIYKIDAYSGSNLGYAEDVVFKLVRGAVWNNYYHCPTIFRDCMMYHISPTLGYVINRSHDCWLNYESDKVTLITVYGLAVEGTEVYKLQRKISLQDDNGTITTTSWATYNYHKDTNLPYTNSNKIWVKGSLGSNVVYAGQQISLCCVIKDQFGSPLSSKEVTFTTNDAGGSFVPADGKVTTDVNGYGELIYRVGVSASTEITISAKATGANANSGGAYIWCRFLLWPKYQVVCNYLTKITQITNSLAFAFGTKIHQPASQFVFQTISSPSYGHIKQITSVVNPRSVSDLRIVRQMQDFGASGKFQQWYASSDGITKGYPAVHPKTGSRDLYPRQVATRTDTVVFSQLYRAEHKSTYLSTEDTIDQFYFVIEVVPAWYSIKNSIVQYIYMRLTPYAYSLNQSTFKMWVKNDWVREYINYTTGWIEVTSQCSITPFGSPLGLAIYYNPSPMTWQYNSRVYVRFQVYDSDPSTPNLMDVTYWWNVIDDYQGPVITNQYPAPYTTGVNVDSEISFDTYDYGYGVDPDNIRLAVGGYVVEPLDITTISGGYHVSFTPTDSFLFDRRYNITIEVHDTRGNLTYDTYYFETCSSTGPSIENAFPRKCAQAIDRNTGVELQIYGVDGGVNVDTILVKIDRKDRQTLIHPIVYRIK